MSEWQPIETAPKDGTEILAAIRVRGLRAEYWERHVIAFDSDFGLIHADCHHGWEWEDYSHWMPLPDPPGGEDHSEPEHVREPQDVPEPGSQAPYFVRPRRP